MGSSLAMWDTAAPFAVVNLRAWCRRCGCEIRHPTSGQRYCTERCRKRAERARWKARWKARGVNKYIGAKGRKAAIAR